jgi:hypothetical protein
MGPRAGLKGLEKKREERIIQENYNVLKNMPL